MRNVAAFRRELANIKRAVSAIELALDDGGPGQESASGAAANGQASEADTALLEMIEKLRGACEDLGIPISVNDTISEANAARLLQKTERTLKRWRDGDGRLVHTQFCGMTHYALSAMADFIINPPRRRT